MKLLMLLGFLVLSAFCSGQKVNAQPPVAIDVANLKATVTSLTSVQPPRNYNNTGVLDSVGAYIKEQIAAYGLSPVVQEFTVDGVVYRNIVASFGDEDSPVLVIGAHYDVFGETPGADDNASGIAGLLELARLLAVHQPHLDNRIELVAYTLEEPPFFRSSNMGSYIHAKSLHDGGTKVVGMICLEMIGYFSDAEDSQEYPLSLMKMLYPSRGDFIGVVGSFGSFSFISKIAANIGSSSLKVQKLAGPSFIKGIDFSDHLNYWKFGYKGAMVTDTAFFRNPNYHRTSDTIDTLNFEKMAQVVEGVYRAILHL